MTKLNLLMKTNLNLQKRI